MWYDLAKTHENDTNIVYLVNILYTDMANEKTRLERDLLYKSFKEIKIILGNILID
jgi:hypothetical protein